MEVNAKCTNNSQTLLCIIADELFQVGVALIFQFRMSDDLRSVVSVRRARLQFAKKGLFGLGRVHLILRDAGEQ